MNLDKKFLSSQTNVYLDIVSLFMATAKYKRILLKLSGESLQGKQNYGHDVEVLRAYAEQIKHIAEMGVEIGIVSGGGNIFRGIQGAGRGFDRV